MFYVAYAKTPAKGLSGQTRASTRGVTGQTQATAAAPPQIARQRIARSRAQSAANRFNRAR